MPASIGTREAAAWSVIRVGIASPDIARARALEYFTGYLIEMSLAVDHVFAWITLFDYFAVPAALGAVGLILATSVVASLATSRH